MNLQLTILRLLDASHGRMDSTQLRNALPKDAAAVRYAMRSLHQAGRISGALSPGHDICITPAGREFLYAHQLLQQPPAQAEAAKQRLKPRLPQRRSDILQAIVAVIGLLVALLELLRSLL